MEDRDKTVVGSYANQTEAMDKIQSLKSEGYKKEDIIVYSKHLTDDQLGSEAKAIQAEDSDYTESKQEDDRSAWDKLKDAFTSDSYDDTHADQNDSTDILYPYREDIRNGNVVIVVQNVSAEQQKKGASDSAGAFANRTLLDNEEMDGGAVGDPLTGGREFDRASEQDNQNRE